MKAGLGGGEGRNVDELQQDAPGDVKPSTPTTPITPAPQPAAPLAPGAGWRPGSTPDGVTSQEIGKLEQLLITEDLQRWQFRVAIALMFVGLAFIAWAFTGGRTEYGFKPSGTAEPRATPTATASATAAPTTAAVTGSATATAMFTKVSGPPTLPARFTDRYSFEAMNGDLTLIQLSNKHGSDGLIKQVGAGVQEFMTSAAGQEYRGTIRETATGTVAEGQNTGTGPGGTYVYNFTMQLSGPLVATGSAPAGVGVRTIAPSPTASPTAETASVATATEGGVNVPLAGAGLLLTLGGLGLVIGGRKYLRGLGLGDKKSGLRFAIPYPGGGVAQVKEEARPDPCAEEKRREAQARARRDAARARAERMDQLRTDAERTRAEADRAAADEKASKDDRHSWWENVETGVRTYTNKDQRGRIERAEAALRAAREAADRARTAYNDAGGGSAHASAQDELRQAESAWQEADAALKACLGQNAAPPPPPPPPPAQPPTPPTAPQPPVTTSPGGPTVAIPTPTRPTQVRECDPPGAERQRRGASATTESIWIPDLRGATVKFESETRQVTDFPIDDFLDWGQFTKESFFAVRKILSLSEGLGPDAGFPVGGALDLVNWPDFLTYYDKMIDAALKALKEAAEQQKLIAKNGNYRLEYRSDRYELRCEPWQRCTNGRWVNFGKSSLVRTGESQTGETDRQNAYGDHTQIEAEVQKAIAACFRQLERGKTAAENQTRRFQERCR